MTRRDEEIPEHAGEEWPFEEPCAHEDAHLETWIGIVCDSCGETLEPKK